MKAKRIAATVLAIAAIAAASPTASLAGDGGGPNPNRANPINWS
ncbi:MAG TPA: hypothetical protein VGJ58_04100 [Gaiellaceae bacterium]|jgi:hypothetical protein